MNRKMLLGLAALMLAALSCRALSIPSIRPVPENRVVGSGHEASQPRDVGANFSAVELAGSGDVNILLTDVQSVNVASDDNIVPLIETKVIDRTLVVSMKPGVNITATNGITITVGIRSLERVTLSGSGNMQVAKMSGPNLTIDLRGSGQVFAEGTVDHVSIDLTGTGNILANSLKAHTADATLRGSGTITLFADQSVNASLPGSGTIRYDGNPPQVKKDVSGSGTILP